MRPRNWRLGLLLLIIGLWAWGGTLHAQTGYIHTWFSVDGGSAVLGAGDYTLTGIAGQADAGQLSTGDYTLTGGLLAAPVELPEETPDSSIFLPKLNR